MKRLVILPRATSRSPADRSVIFLLLVLPFIPQPLRLPETERPRSMWRLISSPILQATTIPQRPSSTGPLIIQLFQVAQMALSRSTPQISITMAIWMSFPPRIPMIRSPGTKTMALLSPALLPEISLRQQMERFLFTPQISITTAIWMCFLHHI